MSTQTVPNRNEIARRLKLFNEKAEKVRRSPFVRRLFGKSHGYSLTFNACDGTLTTERHGVDENATDALLLTLRFFIMDRDRISIKQMKELYDQLVTDVEERSLVEKAYTEHNEALNEPLSIIFEGRQLTRWLILETVLYGERAHANDDKRPSLERWRSVAGFNTLLDHHFEDAVAEVVFFVLQLQQFNDQLLDRLK